MLPVSDSPRGPRPRPAELTRRGAQAAALVSEVEALLGAGPDSLTADGLLAWLAAHPRTPPVGYRAPGRDATCLPPMRSGNGAGEGRGQGGDHPAHGRRRRGPGGGVGGGFLHQPLAGRPFEAPRDRSGLELVVLEADGALVGYAVVWCILDQGELSNIAVAASHRGRGLGRKLLSHAVGLARDRGVEHLFLEVRVSNRSGRDLYGSAGFVELGRRRNYYDQPREDAILMQFSLRTDDSGGS